MNPIEKMLWEESLIETLLSTFHTKASLQSCSTSSLALSLGGLSKYLPLQGCAPYFPWGLYFCANSCPYHMLGSHSRTLTMAWQGEDLYHHMQRGLPGQHLAQPGIITSHCHCQRTISELQD